MTKKFRFVRAQTARVEFEVVADSPEAAEAKVSVGELQHVMQKEGVRVVTSGETTKVKRQPDKENPIVVTVVEVVEERREYEFPNGMHPKVAAETAANTWLNLGHDPPESHISKMVSDRYYEVSIPETPDQPAATKIYNDEDFEEGQ